MGIKIAGREVKVGDRLYHRKFDTFGVVLRVQSKNAELHVSTKQGAELVFYVEDSGRINSEKVVYWHSPIELDEPYQDISHIQHAVDNMVGKQ